MNIKIASAHNIRAFIFSMMLNNYFFGKTLKKVQDNDHKKMWYSRILGATKGEKDPNQTIIKKIHIPFWGMGVLVVNLLTNDYFRTKSNCTDQSDNDAEHLDQSSANANRRSQSTSGCAIIT